MIFLDSGVRRNDGGKSCTLGNTVMKDHEVPDIEGEILQILKSNQRDFLTVSQILKDRLAAPLRQRLGLKREAKSPNVLQKLKPFLGEKTQLYKKYTFIGKKIPLTQIVLNYIKANPNRSPGQLARWLPMLKGEFISTVNRLLEEGLIICVFNQKYTPSLKISNKALPLEVEGRAAFKTAYEAVGKGESFVRIHRIREYLNWPRERFDLVLNQLRSGYTVQLHGGDPSIMTDKEIQDSYVDKNNILYLTMTWVRK